MPAVSPIVHVRSAQVGIGERESRRGWGQQLVVRGQLHSPMGKLVMHVAHVAPIRARCFNSKRTSFHVAIELEHVESVDLRSKIRKADAVLPVFARAGQRGDTLKRVARRGRCRLLFRVGVQHICDTGVSSLAATTLRRFAHLWLRMRGCGKVSNAAETQPHATETHDGDTGQLPSRCVMAHTAHACWLSRAPAGLLGPGGACRSEPIQGRQPVPLDSVALLLRRARLDDAVGRLGLLRIGPRPHHSLLGRSRLGVARRQSECARLGRVSAAAAKGSSARRDVPRSSGAGCVRLRPPNQERYQADVETPASWARRQPATHW